MTNLPHTDGECWCERCVWQAAHDAANRGSAGDPIIWHEKAAASLTAARIRWQEMAVTALRAEYERKPEARICDHGYIHITCGNCNRP